MQPVKRARFPTKPRLPSTSLNLSELVPWRMECGASSSSRQSADSGARPPRRKMGSTKSGKHVPRRGLHRLHPSHPVPFLQHRSILRPRADGMGRCTSTSRKDDKAGSTKPPKRGLIHEDIIEAVPGGFSAANSGVRARAQTGPGPTNLCGRNQNPNRRQWRCTATCSRRTTQSAAALEPASGGHSSASPRRSRRRSEGTNGCGERYRREKVNRS
jgi:hypothetical protein